MIEQFREAWDQAIADFIYPVLGRFDNHIKGLCWEAHLRHTPASRHGGAPSDMPLYVVATDGHALSQPRKMTEFFIGPGERIDVIAVGPPAGEYPLRTISFQNEAWRPPETELQLAVITSNGLSPIAALEEEILRQRVIGPQWIHVETTLTWQRDRQAIPKPAPPLALL
jgi:FtsP/CotA-like multicopper oxidase with cupredoxin domain